MDAMLKSLRILMIVALAGAASGASSQTGIEPAIRSLVKVESDADAHTSTVTAVLNRPFSSSKPSLEDHGTFLQISLPDTIIPESGKFQDGNSPFIRKIATFQTTSNDGAVRLFTSKNAAKTREAATVDVLGERIIVTIDHKKLNAALTADRPVSTTQTSSATPTVATAQPQPKPKTTAPTKPEPKPETQAAANPQPSTSTETTTAASTAEATQATNDPVSGLPKLDSAQVPDVNQVIARTEVREAGPPPAERIVSEPTQETVVQATPVTTSTIQIGKNAPDLNKKLQWMALFSAFMLGLMFVVRWLQPRLRKSLRGESAPEPTLALKSLATLPLAPKQRLMLVQVGHEQILLAVSPDSVNYITTVNGQERSRVPQAAHVAMPAPSAFTSQISASESTLELRRSPGPATERPQRAAPQPVKAQKIRKSINVAIGDDGITPVSPSKTQKRTDQDQSINDITRLIREKLKNLPAI